METQPSLFFNRFFGEFHRKWSFTRALLIRRYDLIQHTIYSWPSLVQLIRFAVKHFSTSRSRLPLFDRHDSGWGIGNYFKVIRGLSTHPSPLPVPIRDVFRVAFRVGWASRIPPLKPYSLSSSFSLTLQNLRSLFFTFECHSHLSHFYIFLIYKWNTTFLIDMDLSYLSLLYRHYNKKYVWITLENFKIFSCIG